MNNLFHRFATRTADAVGSPPAFAIAVILVVGWLASGPLFQFSDTWQLIINTATTISTGLIVFLIQHTQNSDTDAMHIKLDHIIERLPELDSRVAGIEKS